MSARPTLPTDPVLPADPALARGDGTGSGAGVHRLDNTVRDYPWGSTSVIPELLGREPDGRPAAELWIGAHPAAPSMLAEHPDRLDLAALIATDPRHWLGADTVGRFGDRLPFLLKVLAAEVNLSLQAHPSLEQAREGFARENAAGLPIDDPNRNYRDANHKPEQLVALSPFAGLCGFRPTAGTAAFLDALGVPTLSGYRQRLVADGGMRDVVTALLTLPAPSIAALLDDLVPAARRLAASGDEWSDAARYIVRLAEQHPGDRGVALAVLLNLVQLEPGESMFLHAGQIHTYLEGTGVEILANSDNVLRGGLTSKHVDVPELMRVLDVSERAVVPVAPDAEGPGVWAYPSAVPDFRLWRLEPGPDPMVVPGRGARLLVCTAGRASVLSDTAVDVLDRGGSVFVPAGTDLTINATPGTKETPGTNATGGPTTVFLAAANI